MKKLLILTPLLFATHTYGMHRIARPLARQAAKPKLQQRLYTTSRQLKHKWSPTSASHSAHWYAASPQQAELNYALIKLLSIDVEKVIELVNAGANPNLIRQYRPTGLNFCPIYHYTDTHIKEETRTQLRKNGIIILKSSGGTFSDEK